MEDFDDKYEIRINFYTTNNDVLHSHQSHSHLSPPLAHHNTSALSANYSHTGSIVSSVPNALSYAASLNSNELMPLSSVTGGHSY